MGKDVVVPSPSSSSSRSRAVQTTGYCAKRDDAFKILPIGHYCLAFNAASLTALLIDLLIDVVVLLSLPVPVATLAASWLAATADDRKSS